MKIFWFYHIAKTGGTFVEHNFRNLARNLPGASFYDFHGGVEPDEVINLIKKFPSSSEEYIFVHHHTWRPSLMDLRSELENCKKLLTKRGDSLFIFSCLREPVARFTSAWNYEKVCGDGMVHALEQPSPVNQLPCTPTYAHWLADPNGYWRVDNWHISAFLGRTTTTLSKKEIQNILSFMDKVYVTENIGEMEDDLKEIINDKNFCWDSRKRFVTNQFPQLDGTKGKHQTIFMTEKEKSAFLERNKIDSWMYDYVIQMNSRRNKNGIHKKID